VTRALAGRSSPGPLLATLEPLALWLLAGAVLLLGLSSLARRASASTSGARAGAPLYTAPPARAAVAPSADETPDCSKASETPALQLLPIPSAPFHPFFKGVGAATMVSAFRIASAPVTRADFLSFLKCYPQWRRSRATAALSEAAYLSDFKSDLDPGSASLEAPVSFVSWFAARAFCASMGLRLPTTVEWERALGNDADRVDAADAAAGGFAFAMGQPAADLPATGLRTRGVWEWTSDFNSAPEAAGASQFCGDGVRSNAPSDYAAFLRYSFRSSLKAGYALKNLGFRCARDEAS